MKSLYKVGDQIKSFYAKSDKINMKTEKVYIKNVTDKKNICKIR
jgi:hypothetical protein